MADNENHRTVNEALGFPLADEFEKDITSYIDAHSDSGEPLVVVIVDVDEFLHVNTAFGRDAGDRALIETGRHLSADLPEGAKIYRVAGDEFGIIFPGREKEEIFLLMEKCRAAYNVRTPDGNALTISAGISSAFDDAQRYQELMRKAENALYRAKYNGRNRVCLSREDKMVPKTSHYTAEQLKRLTALSKREGIGEAILLREALDMLLKKYKD